jgi:hypothetical protein
MVRRTFERMIIQEALSRGASPARSVRVIAVASLARSFDPISRSSRFVRRRQGVN